MKFTYPCILIFAFFQFATATQAGPENLGAVSNAVGSASKRSGEQPGLPKPGTATTAAKKAAGAVENKAQDVKSNAPSSPVSPPVVKPVGPRGLPIHVAQGNADGTRNLMPEQD